MTRVVLALACVMLVASFAFADAVDTSVRELGNPRSSYKVRLAAALSLSKSKDARAVLALARSLAKDTDPTVRRISALALEKMIDTKTAADAKTLGLIALDKAAKTDRDQKVRETATKAAKALAGLRSAPVKATKGAPKVFVNIDRTVDQSKKLPAALGPRVTTIVQRSIETTGYATTWPGGVMPTAADLDASHAQGYIVASTVKKIDIAQVNGMTEVACTVAVRISPWLGTDGGERWEANRAASASGSAKATTGNTPKQVQGGVRDCLEAVAEDVTARQVVPFLKKLAASGS